MTRLFAGTPWDRPATCERCAKLVAECRCPSLAPTPPSPGGPFDTSGQRVTVRREKRQKGKEVTVVREEGNSNLALSLREDIYYCMLKCGFKMSPKGQVADATVKLSFDTHYLVNGNYGIINMTVFDRNGEPLSRLKYENPHPNMSLRYREMMVNDLVTILVNEVSANK